MRRPFEPRPTQLARRESAATFGRLPRSVSGDVITEVLAAPLLA